jgi:hypothetical protein
MNDTRARRFQRGWGVALPLLLACGSAGAQYNDNIVGTIVQVIGYADGDQILVRLGNQPASHPACNATYFSLPGDVPDRRRIPMFNLLMTAKLTGEPITIGFDNAGNCAEGFIRIHRVG